MAQASVDENPRAGMKREPRARDESSGLGFGGGFLVGFVILAGAGVWFFMRNGNAFAGSNQTSGYSQQHFDPGPDRDFKTSQQTAGFQEKAKRPQSDDLPTSREEALVLLNIDEDTPDELANKIYWAMAKAWHTDLATSEKDRERRESKMKQLNAAKEFLTGKRT